MLINSPYIRVMRLHQPVGIWLLLWPCLWAVALASRHTMPPIDLLLLFAAGAIVMRSAGCIINDIIDKDLDVKVERTKMRPIAAGEISVKSAIVLTCALLFIGLLILLQIGGLAVAIGFGSVFLVGLYPFMKRLMPYPQLVLAFTFNIGAIMGWAAITQTLSLETLLLYMACMCWTMGYDTIYAHQDVRDDRKAGIKSTAVTFGSYSRSFIALFYAGMVLLLAYTGLRVGFGLPFFAGILLVAAHLGWQVYSVDLDNPRDCLRVFRSNTILGGLVLAAIMLEKMVLF